MAGAWIAAVLFIAMVGGGVAYFVTNFQREGSATEEETAEPVVDVSAPVPELVANTPPAVEAAPQPIASDNPEQVRAEPDASLDKITWTVATPATFDVLAQSWSLPKESLVALNPKLSTTEPLAAGTRVVVHVGPITVSESVGPPNDGRLIAGVPFPEGRTWLLPPDRTRAYGTGETVVAVMMALDADATTYPDASPVQLGEISARRGGPIYGHQSHQAGRDIDIRLMIDKAGDRFDAKRNWSLIKTLIESGEVVAIFLNRSQQVWLRAAAEADVGAAGADRYFAIISHESGHTIHMHVRFRCPDSDYRCVAYSLEESDAEVAKVLNKLPSGGGGGALIRNKGKIPTLRPKTGPRPPSGKPAGGKPAGGKPAGGKLPGGKLPGASSK